MSVVIPMYNAVASISEQLDALLDQDFEGELQIVVADNRSSDGSDEIVRDYARSSSIVHLVAAHERQGASHARNVGTRASAGDLVLFADADDVVERSWVSALAAALHTADFVAGSEVSYHAPDQQPTSRLPVSFQFLPWSRGGNLGVRREVFDRVGGWSEDLLHLGEDVDFCWRVQLAGSPLVFVPAAVIRYREREALFDVAKQNFRFGQRAPLLLRHYRHHGARRRSVAQTMRSWFWILTRFPYVFVGGVRRRRWVAGAAGAFGRIIGSIRWRTVCL